MSSGSPISSLVHMNSTTDNIENLATYRENQTCITILDTGVDESREPWMAACYSKKLRDDFVNATESFVGEPKVDGFGHSTNVATLISKIAPEADLYIAKISHGQEADGVDQVIK